jgi:hypothetical protein
MSPNLDVFLDIMDLLVGINTNDKLYHCSKGWLVAIVQSTTNQLTVALLMIRSRLSLWLFSEDASSALLKNRTNVPRDAIACSISAVRALISLTEKLV